MPALAEGIDADRILARSGLRAESFLDRCTTFIDFDGRKTIEISLDDDGETVAHFRPGLHGGVFISMNYGVTWSNCETYFRPNTVDQAREQIHAFVAKALARTEATIRAPRYTRGPMPPLDRCGRCIGRRAPAIAGKCGRGVDCPSYRKQVFGVAVIIVRGFEIDHERAVGLLRAYGERCDPPFVDERRIRKTLIDAAKFGRMPLGKLLREAKP